MNCKSKELKTLQEIRNIVSVIWSETEGIYPSDEVMSTISTMVNKAIIKIDKETDRLIKRNADTFSKHTCSHCESDKIYVCNPCMDDMAKQYDNYPN